jgi:hypothetical protein
VARPIVWPLVADPRKFNRGFREANQTAKRVGAGIAKTASLIGGAFAAIQIGGFLTDAIAEAREAAKVGRQTAAVIKATGGVAKVSAKDVDRLATALSNKVGVDDEIIASGANMLLTFKGVRNEVGKGNDVFNQASSVILDMTAAMNQGQVTQQGLEKATIQVGKALNDPIRGITALTRVGVTFTDAQKDQIRTLVESGKTMDAQKIILRELGSEFGGAAKAAADPWQRLQVVFGNVKESIGAALLPALDRAATFITDDLIPAAEKWWKTHGPKVRESFARLNHIIGVVWAKLKDDLLPALQDAARFYSEELQPSIEGVSEAWRDNKDALGGLKVEQSASLGVWKQVAAFLGNIMLKQVERLTVLFGLSARALKSWFQVGGRVVALFAEAVITMATRVLQAMKAVVDSVPGGSRSGFSKALGRGIDSLRGFRDDFNRQMDLLRNEDVTIDVKGVWVPPKGSGLSMHAIVGGLRRAGGGSIYGPGTSTSDSVPVWASVGEHMWSAREVRGAGGHRAMEAMRARARRMAGGGRVLPDLNLPSAARMGGAAAAAIGRLASMIDRLSLQVPIRGNPGILSFIRSVDPLPYVWGGVGPGGYDCSGLVGEVLNRHLGLRSYTRRFTTSTIRAGQYGLRSGLGGMLNIGVTPGRGHMAGSYMGMGFEAESTRTGIKVGGAASPPSSFARTYHLAKGGAVLADVLGRLGRSVNIGGDPGRLRINGRVLDTGGWLMPGQVGVNLTRHRERVLAPDERIPTATEIARALAAELRANPPVVAVRDLQVGMNHYAGRLGQTRPYR